MIKVVSNASPVIALSLLERLDLLWELFEEVYIPEEVYCEVVSGKHESSWGSFELTGAVKENKVTIYKVKDTEFTKKYYGRLHTGELEVIAAARELKTDVVIIDELLARNFAEKFSLKPIGVVGLLKLAKIEGKIELVKPYLDKLIQNKFRISGKIYNNILLSLQEKGPTIKP